VYFTNACFLVFIVVCLLYMLENNINSRTLPIMLSYWVEMVLWYGIRALITKWSRVRISSFLFI
jgi:hypothetical protein